MSTSALSLTVAFVSGLLAAQQAFAFPTTSKHPVSINYSVQFNQDGFHFDGIVGLSNCSGSLIRFKNSRDNDPGIVLTNGHCAGGMFGGMLKPGEVYYQKPRHFSMSLLDKNARRLANLTSEKIIYATMTDTDITLLELNQSFAEIRAAAGVEALTLADQKPAQGTSIEIPSGYWKRTYSCQIEAFVPTLREGGWTFKDSVRYSASGCEVIGGTSGSPIVSVASGEVVAINNTGNEDGEHCTVNNPCEVDKDGNVSVIQGRGYGQETYEIYSCINDHGAMDLTKAGCVLPKP